MTSKQPPDRTELPPRSEEKGLIEPRPVEDRSDRFNQAREHVLRRHGTALKRLAAASPKGDD